MLITWELAAFMSSSVLTIIGTRNDGLEPEIGRGAGTTVEAAAGEIQIVLSSWQWPGTVANLRANGCIAVTFSRPSDYVSYQIKGRATVGAATADDLAMSDRYLARVTPLLDGFGLGPVLAGWLTNREAVTTRIKVSEVFVQTPGPKAGQPIDAAP